MTGDGGRDTTDLPTGEPGGRTDERHDGRGRDEASRPPLVAMVVVGLVIAATLFALFRSGQSSTTGPVLDDGESHQPAGAATFDLGPIAVSGELETDWIRRERCPGWIQLNSMSGDATTLHVVATTSAPDPGSGAMVDVQDLPSWWSDTIGVDVAPAHETELIGVPAVRGPLVARDGAPERALLVACPDEDGDGGVGIRGPAAGFEQYVVSTTGPVAEAGTVLVLGAAWVGGDLDLARSEATHLAESMQRTDG